MPSYFWVRLFSQTLQLISVGKVPILQELVESAVHKS